jgi:pimeloyl-ACP methyl ester carboxylesterase
MDANLQTLVQSDGEAIAYRLRPASSQNTAHQPGVIFLAGFRSDMTGTKAEAIDQLAQAHGFNFLRFDYFGHGASTGAFVNGTIGRWLADSLSVLDHLSQGPQILVGSSMGGWLALLAALARPDRVKGLVLIAPAPDFTQKLMWPSLSLEAKTAIQAVGQYALPSAYADEPTIITRHLIEEGRDHLILDHPIPLTCPVRILQGMRDPDVPWQHALSLVQALGDDVELTLIKDGDHRLSRPQDLGLLDRTLLTLLG